MKLPIKLTLLASLLLVLTSCTSYRTIAKKEAITKDFLSQLRVNKRYKFELETASTLRVRIDSIDSKKLYGRIFDPGDLFVSRKNNFSDSLENIIDGNVTKISRRGFNPPLTILSIGISTLIVGIIAWGQDPL
jgi:hypothetical protein